MVIVHLYYENVQFSYHLGKLLGEYTRFAAGGFVLVSGMAVGAIFLPKTLRPDQRWKTNRHLWWRSIKLLIWQYVVAVLWVLLGVARGNHPPITSIPKFILDVLTLREGDDLLPLYVQLIALSPFMLACCRIKGGRAALAAISIGLFVFGRFHPYAISLAPPGNFPPLLWQIFFVAGLLCGSLIQEYYNLPVATKVCIAAAAWIAFVILFWAEYWKVIGLPAFPVTLLFAKAPLPLTTWEMLRYVSIITGIIVCTDLCWPRISESAFTNFAATLGRSSLVVYVAHIFLMELAGTGARYWWWMGVWQLTFVPLSVAILWLVAVAVQWHGRRGKKADFQFAVRPSKISGTGD